MLIDCMETEVRRSLRNNIKINYGGMDSYDGLESLGDPDFIRKPSDIYLNILFSLLQFQHMPYRSLTVWIYSPHTS